MSHLQQNRTTLLNNSVVQQYCTTNFVSLLIKHVWQNILLKHKTSLDNILPNTSEREQWSCITEAKIRHDKIFVQHYFCCRKQERGSICTTLLYNTIKESVLSAIFTNNITLSNFNLKD